jgi:uncharacterized protein DUF4337
MAEALERVKDEVHEHAPESRLNGVVALFVVVAATFMALCNVKDGNIVQAMQQSQAKAIDQWNFYQASSMKQHIAENTADLLRVQLEMAVGLSPEQRTKVEAKITAQEAAAKRHGDAREQIRAEAETAAKEYDSLNVHDDQFDLAEACLSIGIALAGVTALTRKWWLLGLACAFAAIGVIYGLAGFLHWDLHSDLMAKVLG